MRTLAFILLACLPAAALAAPNPVAQPSKLDAAWQARTRAMFKTAIEIPTVAERGQMPKMANFIAAELKKGGWAEGDIKILPHEGRPGDQTVSMVARWKGSGAASKKPILILAHMDVVEAKRAEWKEDPFTFIEKDKYFYGRGTSDDKQGVIATTAALIKLREAGFKPNRDIVLFFTGDEETGQVAAQKGVGEWRSLLDAEYALNADAGGGAYTADGRSLGFGIQTAEKIFQSYY